jgi:ubiquinol-cytochrome c reductase cytochrome c1 subunit
MKTTLGVWLLACLPLLGVAGTDISQQGHVDINWQDKAALRDGAHTFIEYCMGCHSAGFQRYERVAKDLDIPQSVLMKDWVFTGAAPGDFMKSSMPAKDAKRWFGAVPADLTLVARVRGNDWLYNYLRSFYRDASRPWGVNNSVFPNVAMPNVLGVLQGVQVLDCLPGATTQSAHEPCAQLRVLPGTGVLNAQQFDDKVRNLVAFLAYSADPARAEREHIGRYVLLYLAVFCVFAYWLKREYWKDVR